MGWTIIYLAVDAVLESVQDVAPKGSYSRRPSRTSSMIGRAKICRVIPTSYQQGERIDICLSAQMWRQVALMLPWSL
jgi:hypothetical protein